MAEILQDQKHVLLIQPQVKRLLSEENIYPDQLVEHVNYVRRSLGCHPSVKTQTILAGLLFFLHECT